jgi:hypothetical protein
VGDGKVFTVRLDATEARRVEFVARVEGMAVNDVFRQAIEVYMAAKRGDADFMARVATILAADAEIAEQLGQNST